MKLLTIAIFFATFAMEAQFKDPRRLERIEQYMHTHDALAESRAAHQRSRQICEEALSDSLAAVNDLTQYRADVIHGKRPDVKRFKDSLKRQISADKLARTFCE